MLMCVLFFENKSTLTNVIAKFMQGQDATNKALATSGVVTIPLPNTPV